VTDCVVGSIDSSEGVKLPLDEEPTPCGRLSKDQRSVVARLARVPRASA
jgi:hypothetical protein